MKVAVVEDDINLRKALEISLKDYPEFEVELFKGPKDALKKLDESFDLVVTDINMPQMDGLEFLSLLGGKYEAVVITANASVNNAIKALRLGAKDFLTKPFEIEDLIGAIQRSQKVKEVRAIKKDKAFEDKQNDFIALSSALQIAKNKALKVAPTDASVMLLGSSGVGKEVFANYIHKNSLRSHKPFVAINMAAIPTHLLESELFGYEKGAFTDASNTKMGLFEEAHGGSIFLDEIGDMPIDLQAKLLRALQEREITRLGSAKPIKIDVRVISATNANIAEKIKNHQFREDLFFRLNTLPIEIPNLKDRVEEIIPLSEWKLQKVCESYGFASKRLSDGAKQVLLEYPWPGNIRELLSVIERATILSEGEWIKEEDLCLGVRNEIIFGKENRMENLERELIAEVIKECNGDIHRASAMLGMSQEVLRSKRARYGI
ncbi:sigma-54-dependent Fis family transcriptional regulator [Helicobacter cholecystus]|uniref:Sigma-54-dependent Fis family transcriptional regulator n=1 Tax=Helicobacter cholecystus TaxID=45498 RepID=A0A3D8IUB5_9HELI|nr:sigma-54 dependent transcriptional regulator [Helicobacter cholecystus]RDU68234.1 sigma-54-dependent Fis family transcriptional regulator [Helicobacter cholecystus]VEJ24467.1 transcriptional activator [Helicobacter cholecystus]